ncbi:hypothetical protein [Sorangium sp. So ce388]|uniref:hypothetical protein n=1 Tax=Sorangium sp. So ce388 TaxID=3133309 RepID=UPI003F5B4172
MTEKKDERVEQIRKRMLDTADMLLQRIQSHGPDSLAPQGAESYAKSAAALFVAATRQYGDPPPDPG